MNNLYATIPFIGVLGFTLPSYAATTIGSVTGPATTMTLLPLGQGPGLSCLALGIAAGGQAELLKIREQDATPEEKQLLSQVRSLIDSNHNSYTVGLTPQFGKGMAQASGLIEPPDIEQMMKDSVAETARLAALDATELQGFQAMFPTYSPKEPPPNAVSRARYDLRAVYGVTYVKNQGPAGTCWDFAACAALESSELKRNGIYADASEEEVLNLADAGTVHGGSYPNAFKYFNEHGVCNGDGGEAPYLAAPWPAGHKTNYTPLFHAAVWGFVDPNARIPSVRKIKEAIVAHGALAISFAVPKHAGFDGYTGGVFDDTSESSNLHCNHAMTIVGWDDNKEGGNGKKGAWIVKNSWGTSWGCDCDYGKEGGYAYIQFESDNIGQHAMWVDAKIGDRLRGGVKR